VIDHLSIGVSDLTRAGDFYDAVLATLGYVRVLTHERALGWGPPGARDEAFAILAARERARLRGVRARSRRVPDRSGVPRDV